MITKQTADKFNLCIAMVERVQDHINYAVQPGAWREPADTLEELAAKFLEDVKKLEA